MVKLTGGDRGGEITSDAPDGTVLELDVGDAHGRIARYEVRTDSETGQQWALFIGMALPTPPVGV